MKTYCFKCPDCGRLEQRKEDPTPYPCGWSNCDGTVMVRDYRAEAVNVAPVK